MTIVIALILMFVGLYLLTQGSDFFVDGASSIAGKYKIPPIVIGLTIVAFGTSLPELLVTLTSALNGSTALALSNVIGSNISNTLLIMGVAGMISPMIVQKNTIWKEIPFSLAAVFIVALLAVQSYLSAFSNIALTPEVVTSTELVGELWFPAGLIMLIFFGVFIYYTFGISAVSGDSDEIEIKSMSMTRAGLFTAGGIFMLTLGSQSVVSGAVSIASQLGISEKLVGLTLVSLGTSLPELFTSINAALKKQSGLVIGNVVGSNIFNILLSLGLTATVAPIAITGFDIADISVLIIATVFLFTSIFMFSRHIVGRTESGSMLVMYALYMVFLFWRQ